MPIKFLKLLLLALAWFLFFPVPPAHAFTLGIPRNFLTLNSNLVGWWTFDGKDMISNVKDRSGQNNTGYLVGFGATSTAVVAGKLGQGLKFDGVDDYVNVGDISATQGIQDITISTWVKSSGFGSGVGLVTKGAYYDGGSSWALDENSDGNGVRIRFSIGQFAYQWTNVSYSTLRNKWVHIVGVYASSTGSMVTYLNGAVLSNGNSGTYGIVPIKDKKVNIGRNSYADGNFNGSFDDVRIYNRALSATEVKQLYNMGSDKINQPLVGIQSGLVGWWTFDSKNMKNNVTDSSGLNNNGNMQGFTSTSSALTIGKLGQGLKFDGVDDYVNLLSPSLLDDIQTTGTGLSIGFWIKHTKYNVQQPFVIGKGNVNSSGFWLLWLDLTGPYVRFAKDFGTAGWDAQDLRASAIFPDSYLGKWKHVTMTWNGTSSSSGVHIYIDGTEVNKIIEQNGTGVAVSDASLNLMIGYDLLYYLNGSIDDVRIYNRALSAKEVQQLYNLGLAKINQPLVGINSGLVGYWTFDGKNMKNNVTDSSGLNNNGNLVGFGATSTAVVAGKIGQALKFDGTTNYINAVTGLNNVSLANGTWSAWIYPKSFTDHAYHTVIAKGYYANWWFGLGSAADNPVGTSGKIQLWVGSAATNSTGAVPLNKWSLITATWNGAIINYYINGVFDSYKINDMVPVSNTSCNLYMGQDYSDGNCVGAGNYQFTGTIDDVRVYNRALAPLEVKQLYNLGR